jgi:hypothetical protein
MRTWTGAIHWRGQTAEVRLVAAKLSPAAARAARRRVRRNAEHHGRKPSALTLEVAGWLLVTTTLDASVWEAEAVLRLYRARWQGELVFKRMKQLLDAHTLRATTQASAEPTVRLLLIAWLLQEEEAAVVRAALARVGTEDVSLLPGQAVSLPVVQVGMEETHPLSSWVLHDLSMSWLRQQVQGQVSRLRLMACLPRLVRFLRCSPRRR